MQVGKTLGVYRWYCPLLDGFWAAKMSQTLLPKALVEKGLIDANKRCMQDKSMLRIHG